MQFRSTDPTIHMPTTLNELLLIKEKHPQAVPYAGGTYLLWNQAGRRLQLPSSILYLRNIKELTRFNRTEKTLEIGATVSIQRVLRSAPKVLSPLLFAALHSICPPSVTNLATLGGNLSVPERCMASFPTFHVLGARCELRSLKRTRWIPVTNMRSHDGKLQWEPLEILTRIQIPMEEWSFFIHRRFGSYPYGISKGSLIIVIAGKIYRGTITEFRFALSNFSPVLYRNRDLETLLIGSSIPIGEKDLEQYLLALEKDLNYNQILLSTLQIERILRILHQTLSAPSRFST